MAFIQHQVDAVEYPYVMLSIIDVGKGKSLLEKFPEILKVLPYVGTAITHRARSGQFHTNIQPSNEVQ